MSKPIDQEREAFERHYRAKHDGFMPSCFGGEYDWNDAQSCWETWQARASVHPAGVAVPHDLRAAIMLADSVLSALTACTRPLERLKRNHGDDWSRAIDDIRRDLLKALAAPHPVSGDLNPEHTLFNEIRASMPVNEDDEPTRYIITEAQLQRIRSMEFRPHLVSGEQKPVAVLRYQRLSPGLENEMPAVISCSDMPDGDHSVYASPPAAQDVAGLVGALMSCIKANSAAEVGLIVDAALAAHRAQQGGVA